MNLKTLSDSELLKDTEHCASEERRFSVLLIEHLREVQRRKLYSDLGYGSLFQYCLKELKLSEGSAQRRIDAMRLAEALPEVTQKIESGKMNLSVASRLQAFIRQEEKTTPVTLAKQRELLGVVEGKSFRDAEHELFKYTATPQNHVPERTRAVSETHTQITFTVTAEQMALFERVRAQLAHSLPGAQWAELFSAMAEKVLTKPKQRSASPTVETRRTPSLPLKRAVVIRDGGVCVKCGSRWALEFDHIHPWAKGGETRLENLRLLCRSCNQREAVRQFGLN